MAGLSLVLFLGACGLKPTITTENYETDRASRLFAAGFQDIADIYIDEIPISELAMAGIENLSSIDPEVLISQQNGKVTVTANGKQVAKFPAPPAEDADRWGEVAAYTANAGRLNSRQLALASAEDLYEAVFDGVTERLDSFSRYAGREEARENRASRDGFGGIGVRISLIDAGVKILSVMENTPAESAGLKDSDVIVMIDGRPVQGLSQRDVVRRLRGPLRSEVTLTIDRSGEIARKLIAVTRAHIVPQTIKYIPEGPDGKIAYIRISGFNQSTAKTLRTKIEQAESEIEGLLGFVLDLRNNPGGLLDQSVAVSDLFMTSGRIVSTHGRHPDSHQYFDANAKDTAIGLPVVVLINGHSASASEIVAAALQDSGRAVVVGSNSFGKGTVQTVLRLPNEGELTLTWARFHAPAGYGLNRRGVLPDICTSGDVESVDEVFAYLRSGRFPFDRATQRRDIELESDEVLEEWRSQCPLLEGDNEFDLEVAVRLLSDPTLYALALGGAPDTAQDNNQISSAPKALSDAQFVPTQ